VELIDAKQKNVTKHTFNRECGGIAKPPGPHFDESEWSRWSVKSTEEAVTFTIDHPIPAEHLKAGFGMQEIVSFHKDGQWVLVRDHEVLIRGRVNAAQ